MGTPEIIPKDKKHHPVSKEDKRAAIGDALIQVMDCLADALLLLNTEWRIVYANDTARRISRIREEDLNGETLWNLYPELCGAPIEQAYREALLLGEERHVEAYFYEPFKTWYDLRILPRAGGLAVHYRDVTNIRRLEVERDSSAERLNQVLEATTDAVISLDRTWRVTYLNARGREILSPRGDLLGKNLWESFPEAVYEGSPYVTHYYRTMNDGIPAEFESYYPEPLHRWLRILARPSKDGIIIFFRDVTEEKLQADALRASEERYRVLTELNPQAIWTADASGRVLYANQRFLDYIGHDFVPRTGEEYIRCFHEDDRERVVQVWSHSVATGEDYTIDARLLRASDGAARWWHLRALPLRDANGAIQQWLGVATDVHENYLAAEQLHTQYAEIDRQRRELEALYRGSPIGLSLYEPRELRLIRVNKRQAEILGLEMEQALGKTVEEIAPGLPHSHAMIRRAAAGVPMLDQQVEGVLPTRPGEYRYWHVNYTPVFADDGSVQAIAGATIEVTQQKRSEAALIQAEKLAAVGRLASSIAHEINNPLESVTNLLYLAGLHAVDADARRFLEGAEKELQRVSLIANQTLRFHKQATRPQAVSCTELFSSVLGIFEGRFKNARVVVEKRKLAKRPVVCFEGDIRQVLNNLVGNSVDAMPQGGRLLLRSREATDWKTGRRGLVLTVADNGVGMDEATRTRALEAFFTTKGFNGTGLGLWISAEIMQRHQGRMRMRSSQQEQHHGTVVTLFLPFDTSAAG